MSISAEILTAAAACSPWIKERGLSLAYLLIDKSCLSGLDKAIRGSKTLGKLFHAGKLPANHHLEKLAQKSLFEALSLLGVAIESFETEGKRNEIDLNYAKDQICGLLRNKEALTKLFQSFDLDSALHLEVTAAEHTALAKVLHPIVIDWFRSNLSPNAWPDDEDVPPFLVSLVEDGFADPYEPDEKTSFAHSYASHFLAKLKHAKSNSELATLRAFERLENADLRRMLAELKETRSSKPDPLSEEQLADLARSINSVTLDLEGVASIVSTEADRILKALTPPIKKLETRSKKFFAIGVFACAAALIGLFQAGSYQNENRKEQAGGKERDEEMNSKVEEMNSKVEEMNSSLEEVTDAMVGFRKYAPSQSSMSAGILSDNSRQTYASKFVSNARKAGKTDAEIDKILSIVIKNGTALERAQAFAAQGQLDQSDKLFREVLHRNKMQAVVANYGLGQNALDRYQFAEAYSFFTSAAADTDSSIYPKLWTEFQLRACDALRMSKSPESVTLAESVLDFCRTRSEFSPTIRSNVLATYAATLSQFTEDYDTAEEFYLEALEDSPKRNDIVGGYATFLWKKRGDYKRAEKLFTQAATSGPKSPGALTNFAVFLWEFQRNKEEADKFYNQAIQEDPENPFIIASYAGFLVHAQNDYKKAEELFDQAIEKNPSNLDVLLSYAWFLWKVPKKHQLAEDYFKRALEIDPNHSSLLGHYAVFLWQARANFDSAEGWFKDSLHEDPLNASALANYAKFRWVIRKDNQGAQDLFERAIKVSSNQSASYHSYAKFLWKGLEMRKLAAEKFAAAVELDPQNINILMSYAFFLGEDEKTRVQAAEVFTKSFKPSERTSVFLTYYAAFVEKFENDDPKAERLFRQALKKNPENGNSLRSFSAFLRDKRGREKEASELLAKALELEPNHPKALYLRAQELWRTDANFIEAERYYKDSIEADPIDSFSLGQ